MVRGNPSSGLLPRIALDIGGAKGGGDRGVQAFNYRWCLTNVPANRVKISKPSPYNEEDYELVFRIAELGLAQSYFIKQSFLPNRKIDANNSGIVSTDYVGMNWNWAEADYNTRQQIARQHELWQRGLLWTLQNHPRIPEPVRNYYSEWGLAKDEFVENRNWPYELYVREGRRMISDYVITENTALSKEAVNDSVGLSDYRLDSHEVQYYLSPSGTLASDGAFYIGINGPFRISYQAVIPKRTECCNLLVPVCLSASHVAYGSIRMEPQFMMLGQSTATAASIAIDLGVGVQDVPYDQLRQRLLKDQQIFE